MLLVALKVLNICILLELVGCQNIFKDGDFEDGNHKNWICTSGCTMVSITDDKVSGSRAIKITDRTHSNQGPMQAVHLSRNSRYHLVWSIKQLNKNPSKLFQEFRISGNFELNPGHIVETNLVRDQKVRPERGWIKLEGYIMTPDKDFTNSSIFIQMADPGIEFLVDAAILTAIPEDKNWKQKADARIEKYRKNNINVRVKVPSQSNVQDYQVEIRMTRHAFPFGSKVTEEMILKPEYSHFRELFYYMFNYATMASYFWAWSSGPKESPDYSAANTALDILKQHGIPARGHNIFWNEWVFNPNWTRYMPPTDSNREVEHRIDYIMKYTKGRYNMILIPGLKLIRLD